MFRKILIIFNPVTLFLLFNIIIPREVSLYEKVTKLENIEYVNIGSSHGRDALNWEDFYLNSINLGFSSQRMYYGLRLLEPLTNSINNQTTIIIPISIFSFCGKYEGPKQRYLGLISRKELNISYEDYLLHLYFPYLGIDKNELLFYQNISQLNPFIENGVSEAKSHIELAKSCNVIDNDIVNLTREFIANNDESRIVFIITPYYKTYWSAISESPDVMESIYSTIIDIVSEYGLEFYDYSHDVRFVQSIELFRDSSHLNDEGSKKFTSIFVDDLNNSVSNAARK